MKKLLVALMATMLLFSTTTYATELSKVQSQTIQQMSTMSKSEALDMLKQAGVEPSKIKMLENGEMAETEGEFWQFLIPLFIGWGTSVANAPAHGEKTYSGSISGFFIKSLFGW